MAGEGTMLKSKPGKHRARLPCAPTRGLRLPNHGLIAQQKATTMFAKTLDQHIEISPEVRGGKPRITGRRITVADIVIWHEWLGRSADEIATEHDLTLADVYAALTFLS